jgi:DinB superfamily
MTNPRVQQLLAILARAYDRRSWHGTNLRGSVRGLDPATAARRPAPGRHNIWELVVHAAYWKYAVWRRLAGEKRGTFPLQGSNWFPRPLTPGDGDAAWKRDVALLGQMHAQLIASVGALADMDLDRVPRGATVTRFELIAGVAAHDLYHAGQIQLIKKVQST